MEQKFQENEEEVIKLHNLLYEAQNLLEKMTLNMRKSKREVLEVRLLKKLRIHLVYAYDEARKLLHENQLWNLVK
jgi:hypothetical protein